MKLLSDIPEARRTRALECFRVLRPIVEDGVPLTTVAREAGLPLRTTQRWMATYKREGLAGLARLTRSDRGHCHKLPAQLERVVEGLALRKPRPSMAAVQRRAAATLSVRGPWLWDTRWPISSPGR